MSVNIEGHFTGDTKLCKQFDNLKDKAKKLRKDQDKVIKKLKKYITLLKIYTQQRRMYLEYIIF